MSGEGFYLICCTEVALREVADKRMKRRDLAKTYALAMRSENAGVDRPDWKAINAAIIGGWSFSALNWIKEQAHSGRCWEDKPAPESDAP